MGRAANCGGVTETGRMILAQRSRKASTFHPIVPRELDKKNEMCTVPTVGRQ